MRSFLFWRSFISFERSRSGFRESIERAVSLTEDRVKQEQHHMYQNLLEQISRENDSYVTSIKAKFSEDKRRLEEKAQTNVRRVAEDGNMRLVKILEDRKSDWDKKEQMIRCQHVTMMEKQAEVSKEHLKKMSLQFQEKLQFKMKEMEQGFSERYKIMSTDYEERLESALNEARLCSKLEVEENTREMAEKQSGALRKLRCEFEVEKKELQQKHDKYVASIRNTEKKKALKENEKAIIEAISSAESKAKSQLLEKENHFNDIKQHLIDEHDNNLKFMVAAKEREMTDKVEFIRSTIEDEARCSMKVKLENIKRECELSVQQEAEKWKKVRLKDFI